MKQAYIIAGRWKMFLNSEDDFLLVVVGDKDEYNIISENGFALFRGRQARKTCQK